MVYKEIFPQSIELSSQLTIIGVSKERTTMKNKETFTVKFRGIRKGAGYRRLNYFEVKVEAFTEALAIILLGTRYEEVGVTQITVN